jgi:hypothetical protein
VFGQAVEQERKKEREKKISVKERVMLGKQRTADAERLQRHSGRVAE